MPVAVRAQLDGLQPLLSNLSELKRGARNKILRPVVNAMAGPVLDAARTYVAAANYPYGSVQQLLLHSLTKIVKTGRNGPYAVIGPATGMKQEVTLPDGTTRIEDPAHIAHLVEFGASPHTVVGPHPGAQAKPFMRPAYDGARTAAMNAGEQKLAEGIEKYA